MLKGLNPKTDLLKKLNRASRENKAFKFIPEYEEKANLLKNATGISFSNIKVQYLVL